VRYGVNGDELVATLKCESGFNAKAIGDHGTSFGVAQIHISAHKEVSKEEALDPLFSINFAAKAFSEGHQNWWTCYKKQKAP
jgi:hypothetical protein